MIGTKKEGKFTYRNLKPFESSKIYGNYFQALHKKGCKELKMHKYLCAYPMVALER